MSKSTVSRPLQLNQAAKWRQRFTAAVIVVCVGCAESSIDKPVGPGDDVAAESQGAQRPANNEGESAPIALKPVSRQEFDVALEGLRGQVVLVDFWATWCGPCMEQLPHTTALAKSHRGADLVVVTMCMDEPEEAPRIAKLLESHDVGRTTNLISRAGGGPRAMEAFQIPGGALPHYRLYDRAGTLRQSFELDPSAPTQFSSDDVAAAVENLLAE
jgi:thiol-disulfide isomerase/thioredoxin